MIIFPAIDIKNGECVRLKKGDFDTVSKVFSSPLNAAESFFKQGANHVHIVDLDGSLKGSPVNRGVICEIKSKYDIFCEVGGGIREIEHIEYYLEHGIDRIILGTVALSDPDFLKRCVERFDKKISVSIDALKGKVKTNGWIEGSDVDYIDLASDLEKEGVSHIIYTDIDRDGLLNGPNFDHLQKLKDTVNIDITASGGIRDLDHIRILKKMDLYGAICGKSIYSGTLDLAEAIRS